MANYHNSNIAKLKAMAERLQADGFKAVVVEISPLDEVTHGNSYVSSDASYRRMIDAYREPSDLDHVPGRAP